MNGDGETVKGLKDILYDAGVQRWSARARDDRFEAISEVIEKLDKNTLDDIQKSFDAVFSNL